MKLGDTVLIVMTHTEYLPAVQSVGKIGTITLIEADPLDSDTLMYRVEIIDSSALALMYYADELELTTDALQPPTD